MEVILYVTKETVKKPKKVYTYILLRIPKAVAEKLGLREGRAVRLRKIDESRILIEKIGG